MRGFTLNTMLAASVALAIALNSTSSRAEDAERAQLIRELIQAQQGEKAGLVETQVARMMLQQAKQVNPNAGQDKWLAIQADVNEGIAKLAAQGDGAIETMTRAGVANMSDAELTRLLSLYRDPVLVKYMSVMSSPVVQAQARQATLSTGLRVSALVNSALEKNGLQGIH